MQTFAPRGNIHGPILPQYALESSMSLGAKVLYAILCNYAGQKDCCWPSQTTLATRLRCSVSSVKKYIAELKASKLIFVETKTARSSLYYILRPAALSGSGEEGGRVQACAPASQMRSSSTRAQLNADRLQPEIAYRQANSGYINNKNKQTKIKHSPPIPPMLAASPSLAKVGGNGVGGVFSADFEKAWAAYPRKEAKGLAWYAWQRLRQENALPETTALVRSLQAFAASEAWKRENGRFIPQMSNWLRGQRWLDAVEYHDCQASEQPSAEEQAHLQRWREQEARRIAQQRKRRNELLPKFEAFIRRFSVPLDEGRRHLAFGRWMFLHDSRGCFADIEKIPVPVGVNPADFIVNYREPCSVSPDFGQ